MPDSRATRVLHIITSLGLGGTESVLLRLLERTTSTCEVIGLQPDGVIGEAIARLGVPVHSLQMRLRVPSPAALRKLWRQSRAFAPDVVQTWLYAADLAGAVAGRAAHAPVVWNVRNTMIETPGLSRGTRAIIRLAATTSRLIPARIVYGSQAAAKAHVRGGYPAEKSVVIPNGIDVERFRRNAEHRRDVRDELRVPPHAVLIGLIARFDPLKDHRTFLDAAAHLGRDDVLFVLSGEGIDAQNQALVEWIHDRGLAGRTRLLGRRMDIERVMAALDLAVLSSYSEGFPNVVAEAMACAVPAVVTDVGDAAEIVGDTGRVVPVRDPEALAGGMRQLIEDPGRHALGERARARVVQLYSLDAMVARYDALHAEIAGR